ncbi:MAG: nuclear transport factor 2 family protein [Saprospiraceae bacterium]|nr:nuclear transport factor 2 family protein [Candidatus Vicinibacter affinis]
MNPTLIFFRIVSFLFFLTNASAQKNELLLQKVQSLNQALLSQDSSTLRSLLHKDLSYGHSNGWIENVHELIHNNATGYLKYQKIEADSISVKLINKTAVVRFNATHDIILNGKSISLKLHVCQTWIKDKRKWKLLARQSTKVN